MKTSNIASSDALGGHHGGADFRGWVGLGGRGHDGSPWTTEEVYLSLCLCSCLCLCLCVHHVHVHVGLGGCGHDGSPRTTEEVPIFYNFFHFLS